MIKSKPRRDLYQEITDRIIAALETGTAPWVKPWNSSHYGMPMNGATGRSYSGINVFLLWATPYYDNRWYTFKQAKSKAGNVRKGEKGTNIIFFKPFITESPTGKERFIPMIRGFTVFNHSQIDWENEETIDEPNIEITFVEAENMVKATKAKIRYGDTKAFYSPNTDEINMPDLENFRSEADYWGTMLHELTHWTGHKDRKNRQFGARFGDDAYAMEELVAEMGAAFLCAQSAVEGKLQHANYIDSWLKVLKKDKRAIFTAAKQAQQAADFVVDFTKSEKSEKVA